MNDKEMFDFYQTHYYHEIDAREKYNTRMQIPIAIFATQFSIIAYFLKTSEIVIDDFFNACCFGFTYLFALMAIGSAYMLWKSESRKNISPKHLIQFIFYISMMVLFMHQHKQFSNIFLYHFLGYIMSSVILIFPSMYYFIRASVNYEYKYMPLCDATEKYNNELKEYYSGGEHCDEIVSEKMYAYIRSRYIECSSINGANNESRSYYFHMTYIYMILSFTPICLAVGPYYLGRVNIESDAVHKIEIIKTTSKGEYSMRYESQPPKPSVPTPTPPPARVIKEGVDPKQTNK